MRDFFKAINIMPTFGENNTESSQTEFDNTYYSSHNHEDYVDNLRKQQSVGQITMAIQHDALHQHDDQNDGDHYHGETNAAHLGNIIKDTINNGNPIVCVDDVASKIENTVYNNAYKKRQESDIARSLRRQEFAEKYNGPGEIERTRIAKKLEQQKLKEKLAAVQKQQEEDYKKQMSNFENMVDSQLVSSSKKIKTEKKDDIQEEKASPNKERNNDYAENYYKNDRQSQEMLNSLKEARAAYPNGPRQTDNENNQTRHENEPNMGHHEASFMANHPNMIYTGTTSNPNIHSQQGFYPPHMANGPFAGNFGPAGHQGPFPPYGPHENWKRAQPNFHPTTYFYKDALDRDLARHHMNNTGALNRIYSFNDEYFR